MLKPAASVGNQSKCSPAEAFNATCSCPVDYLYTPSLILYEDVYVTCIRQVKLMMHQPLSQDKTLRDGL